MFYLHCGKPDRAESQDPLPKQEMCHENTKDFSHTYNTRSDHETQEKDPGNQIDNQKRNENGKR
jgi:hypothetical protein